MKLSRKKVDLLLAYFFTMSVSVGEDDGTVKEKLRFGLKMLGVNDPIDTAREHLDTVF